MRLIIAVTQRDIDRGRQRICEACPIAIAVERQLGYAVELDFEGCIAREDSKRLFDVPIEMERWMDVFDARGGKRKAKPTRFCVELQS